MEQGSQEWKDARLGKITASRFSDVMAKGKGTEFGKTAYSYAYELIAEEFTGMQKEFSNAAMEWGTEHEVAARLKYQRETFNAIEQVGFIQKNVWVGCSPDGLVDNDGLIEIKCPYNSSIHMKNVSTKELPFEYKAQVQGELWVTDRIWCDFVSYDPRFKNNDISIIRINRDKEYIEELATKIAKFKNLIDSLKKPLKVS